MGNLYQGSVALGASGGVDSLLELGVTATAAELNYVDGVTSNIQTQLDALASEIDGIDWFGNSTSIPSNSDLDTYTTIGKYYAVNDATAKTLVNCPVTSNFVLYVYHRTTGSINQLIMSRTGIHMRGNNSSGEWSAWKVSLNANSDGGALAVSRGGTGFDSIEDTIYTDARYRASSLHSAESTPTINGVICWMYE